MLVTLIFTTISSHHIGWVWFVTPLTHRDRKMLPRTLRPSRLSWRPAPPSDVFGVPGSRPRPHAPDIERLSALAARNDRVHVVVARGVVENERRKVAAKQPFVTERRHNCKDRTHVAALVRKAVLVAHWALLVGHLLQQAVIHEAVEPGSQDVAAGAQLALELLEPPRAEARLAKDEQRPAVADEIGGAGDRAGPSRRIRSGHEIILCWPVA